VRTAQDLYPECPELLLVTLACSGDRGAFGELVRRRQSAVRNLMRRCCGDPALADDLAQQVFMKAWLKIRSLRHPRAFSAWLRRLAITEWLQFLRKKDPLRHANELAGPNGARVESPGVGLDLDQALATLSPAARLCVVLAYGEGMSHREIAELTDIPLGTVKSHIQRGAERLREILSAYREPTGTEATT
jgi:RNA polymerase sigma factor (sigma-70 family)